VCNAPVHDTAHIYAHLRVLQPLMYRTGYAARLSSVQDGVRSTLVLVKEPAMLRQTKHLLALVYCAKDAATIEPS